jgi:DNA-directed RNA polymerase specialized sigma subunit
MFEKYDSMKTELHDTKKDIKKTEDEIIRLVEAGTVQDRVKGGLGGIQTFKIEGFPQKEYDERMRLLRSKQKRLLKKENQLLEYQEEIETSIDEIENYRDRQILRKRFIEHRKQQDIADEMYIDRSLVSKIISKYV